MRHAALFASVLGVSLTGCGGGSGSGPPLPKGAQITAQSRECPVSPDQCFDYEIVTTSEGSSEQLRDAQVATMKREGWELTAGVTRNQTAACSADKDAFVSIATGNGELADNQKAARGGDGLRWSEKLRTELRKTVAAGTAAITRTLEEGC